VFFFFFFSKEFRFVECICFFLQFKCMDLFTKTTETEAEENQESEKQNATTTVDEQSEWKLTQPINRYMQE